MLIIVESIASKDDFGRIPCGKDVVGMQSIGMGGRRKTERLLLRMTSEIEQRLAEFKSE